MDYCKRLFALLLVLCMVIPMTLVSVNAEATISYEFYDGSVDFGTENNGIANSSIDPNKSTLSANYGTNKFLPLADSSDKGYLYIYNPSLAANPAVKGSCTAINELLAGDWIAIKFKNPGVGTYNVDLRFYRTANTKCQYNAYILPGSTSEANIPSALISSNQYATGNQMYQGMGSNGDLNTVTLDKQLNVSSADGDFILVLQVDALTNNATKTRMYIEGITLTTASAGSSDPVTPTTPAATTPAATTPVAPTTPATPSVPDDGADYRLFSSSLTSLSYNDKGELSLSKQYELLANLYNSGAMDVIPVSVSTVNQNGAYLNYGAASGGSFEFNGLKLQKAAVGDYVALKFRSPGSGVYSISLDNYYLNANNAARMAVYMLPGSTAAASIDSMLVDENLIGKADVMNQSSNVKTEISVTVTNGVELEANKDYILVFKFDQDNYQPDPGRVDVMMTGLSFGEGFIGAEAPFDAVSGDVALSEAVKAASFYRACTGVNPANGHDLLYLLFKGQMMLVYDLDTKELVDKEKDTHSTPFGMTFDNEGNLWLTGTGTFIYKYNPATGEGRQIKFNKSDFFGGSTNSYGGVIAEGYFYFGYNGALGRVNMATEEVERISERIRIDTTVESDAKYCGYSGIIYRDGYLYTAIHGDENGDQIYTSAVIKFDLVTRQIVDYVDVKFATRIPKEEVAYGVTYLNEVNDLLIGTFSNRKPGVYIDISGDKMQLVESLPGFDTCFTNQFTDEINGKLYACGYVDNETTTRCLYEYDLATGKITRLGDIYFPTTLGLKYATATLTWDDKLPGTSIVTATNNSATGMVDVVFYNIQTDETVYWSGITEGEGTGMTLRALTSDETGRYIYVGAYGTNLITQYDTVTGEYKSFLGTDHQTDSLCWYDGKLYIGNYHGGTITQMDVTTGDITPYFSLIDSVFQQERMFGITAGDNKVFCGTVPDASRTGGTLVWYDLEENRTYVASGPNPEDVYYADYASFVVWHNYVTGEAEDFDLDGDGRYDYDILKDDKGDSDPTNDVYDQVIKGLIPTQCPNDLVYKDGYIYGCTTKSNGDAVATVFDGNAVLFVYDVQAKKLVSTYDVTEAIPGIENPQSGYVDYIDVIAADPYEEGKFWGVVCDTLFSFTFDHTTNTFSVTEELSLGKDKSYRHATSTWHSRTILFDGDYMYVGFHNNGLYMVNTADTSKAYPISVYTPAGGMALGQDGNIYYISNQDSSKPISELCVFNIAEGTQPVVAQSVQALIDALPETVTLENEAQVMSLLAMYNDLREGAKTLVDATKLNAAVAALEPLQAGNVDSMIDAIGEVTLESEAAITAARNAYNALTEGAKAKVTKLPALEAAEAKLAELKAAGPVDPEPAPNGDLTTIVIIAVAAVVLIAGAVTVLVLTRKKKQPAAEAPSEEKAEEPKQDEE